MILDYRNIPYEELDSNIPYGRGMIKWMPFATMPEQYENIDQMIHELSLMSEPKLSQDLLEVNERIAFQLVGQTAIIRYWSDGIEKNIECKIESINHEKGTIKITDDNDVSEINFFHIYDITKGGYLDDIV